MKVPRRLQPPNPPAPFLGREALAERIASAIARAPVTVLWGFSGAGKSALLAHVLATRFDAERARTLVIDASAARGALALSADALLDLAIEQLRALGRGGASDAAMGDLDDTPSALLDALESDALWLVLENVERIEEDSALRDAIELLQRFARGAKLLVVCREDPRMAALAGQTLAVGLMSDEELCALLALVRPGIATPDARQLARLAQGSPWRALQLSVGGVDAQAGPEASLLALAPVAQGVLRTLALVTDPISRTALARATRGADDATLDTLVRRGYLELDARGVRLHDAARALVTAQLAHDERALREPKLLRALLDDDSPEAARGALALLERNPAVDALSALLARHGRALREQGLSEALLELLLSIAQRPEGVRAAWACALALDVGSRALARVPTPGARDDEARAWFAQVKRARAHEPLVVTELPGDPALARALRAAHAATHALEHGRPESARALVADLPHGNATFEGRAIALAQARAAFAQGELHEARARFASVAACKDADARLEALTELAALRLFEGDLDGLVADSAALAILADEHGAARAVRERLEAVQAATRALQADPGSTPRAALHAPRALHDAVRALVDGHTQDAERMALSLRGAARDTGLACAALEAGVVALDAATVLDHRERVAMLAQQLAVEAGRAGSRRFALEARFALACTSERIDPSELVELAARMSASPVVARRASALLGENVALDTLDALVLAKLKPRTSGAGQVIRADGDAAWTLDVLAMRVLLPDGRSIDLSAKKVLFDLLVALCKHGGSATKEQLLERAWGVREYHPLRHDNRLKVAVRKLRRLLEETLGDDPLEATEDGYRLRGHVRLVRDTQP